MKAIIKFLKIIFIFSGGYTSSTGPGDGGECQCKNHEHSGKFGPG